MFIRIWAKFSSIIVSFLSLLSVATFRKGVRAIQLVGRASELIKNLPNFNSFRVFLTGSNCLTLYHLPFCRLSKRSFRHSLFEFSFDWYGKMVEVGITTEIIATVWKVIKYYNYPPSPSLSVCCGSAEVYKKKEHWASDCWLLSPELIWWKPS